MAKNNLDIESTFLDPLSKEDERVLLLRYESLADGPEKDLLRSTITRHNLRFVASMSKSYSLRTGLDRNDLYAEGKLCMLQCLDDFKTSKNVKFISYAVWHVKKGFIEVSRSSRMIRHNVTKKSMAKKALSDALDEAFDDVVKDVVGEEATLTKDIADVAPTQETTEVILEEILEETVEEVIEEAPVTGTKKTTRPKIKRPFRDNPLDFKFSSLDQVVPGTEDLTLQDIIADENASSEEDTILTERKTLIHNLLEDLPERERLIMKMYYGIDYDERKSLTQIGIDLDISKERCRQILDRAKKAFGEKALYYGLSL